MSYKASVSNIYELLDEDGGPTPQVNIGGEAPVKKTGPPPAKQTQAKPKQDAPKVAAAERPAQQKAPRQERSIDKRPPREFSSPKAGEEETAGKERRVNNREGGERRFDRERGGGRGAYVPRGNKRPYDRRSGTGRGREVTKGGAGKGNWGTYEDEQKVEGEESTTKQEEKTEGKEVQGEQPQTTEAPVEQKEAEKVPEEEEDKTRTLDEFLKSKATVKVDLPKLRQAGEGVENPEWNQYVPLIKKKEDESQVTKPEKKATPAQKKEVVPVNQVFEVQAESPSRQRRDRPYGNSQRGGRGGKRGGSSGKAAPNVQDEAAFPSLSTKA